MTRVLDRALGYFCWQDHRQGVPVPLRLGAGGVRVIDPKGGDDEHGHFTFDRENGGSFGDHPGWRLWYGGDRGCPGWAQALLSRVTGASKATKNTDDRGRTITGAPQTWSATALPIRSSDYKPDPGFKAAEHGVPRFWPAIPVGTVVIGMAGTHEGRQDDLLGWCDPRFPVVNKNPFDAMGGQFVDLEPAGALSIKRVAKGQTLIRVAHMPSLKLGSSRTPPGWVAAWQHELTGQGHEAGLGAVYGQLEAESEGPTTPGEKEPPKKTPVVTPGEGSSGSGPGGQVPPGSGAPSVSEGLEDLKDLIDREIAEAKKDADPRAKKKKEPKRAIALYSWTAWGPMHPGSEHDKHQFEINEDGEPVNSGHFDCDRALWHRDKKHDAPIEFDREPYGPAKAPLRTRAWCRYDVLSVHPWNGEAKEGLWRYEAESHFAGKSQPPTTPREPRDPDGPPITPSEPPPEPKEPPPTTPGDPLPPPTQPPPPNIPPITPPGTPLTPGIPGYREPGSPLVGPGAGRDPMDPRGGNVPRGRAGGGGTTGGRAESASARRFVQRSSPSAPAVEEVAYSPMQIGFPGALAFPQHFGRGGTDLRYSSQPDQFSLEQAFRSTPAVVRFESFGKESGVDWGYTQRPHASRVPGGTAPGFMLVVPPEVDGMDVVESLAPSGLTRSTTGFGWGPGAYAYWGAPERVAGEITGDLANGSYRASVSTAGDLTFQRRASGTWSDVLSLLSTGRARFSDKLTVGGGLALLESAAPPVEANSATFYADDDGASGTRVRLIFPGTVEDRVVFHENPHKARTADLTIVAADNGKTFSNDGAVGTVIFTLPACAAGLRLTFFVMEAFTLRVVRAGADVIFSGAGVSSTQVEASAKGRTLTLEGTASGEWYVYSIVNVWTFS